jgi:hypothetical protein
MHLDVKPSNFLVRIRRDKPEQPDLFLADFGIAKVVATSKGSSTMRGTLEYMAPEQWDGHPSAASDQYSLAIMAYELLTGSVPFRGNMSQIMFKHFREIPQPPGKLRSGVPMTFDSVILRALAKKPEERFATISEFAQVLQRGLQRSGEMQRVNAQSLQLRATLAISVEEARNGTQRTLTLPNGRRVVAAIPAGIVEGHVIRFNEQGEVYDEHNLGGAPLLAITIHIEAGSKPNNIDVEKQKATVRSISTVPPVPATQEPVALPLLPGLQRSIEQIIHRMPSPLSVKSVSSLQLQSVKRRTWFLFLSLAAACLVIASMIGFTAYQNNVNPSDPITATAAAANPYPSYFTGRGTIALNDSLNQAGNWSESSNTSSGGTCSFTGGAYHVSVTNTGNYYDCYLPKSYGNFAFQVQMTIVQGDCGGITFREDSDGVNFYAFRVCQNGNYYLDVNWNGKSFTTERSGSNSLINRGLNQRNSIAVLANVDAISVYVNGHIIDSINNAVYSNGTVGLLAFGTGNTTEVAYNDAKMWTF